jgi:hypothetical protein
MAKQYSISLMFLKGLGYLNESCRKRKERLLAIIVEPDLKVGSSPPSAAQWDATRDANEGVIKLRHEAWTK